MHYYTSYIYIYPHTRYLHAYILIRPTSVNQTRMQFLHHFDGDLLLCPFRLLGMKKMGEEVYVIAKYDYTAQDSQELDIHKNEKLLLLDDSKHWWKVQNAKNQAGFVPSNFVKKAKPSILTSLKNTLGRRKVWL